MRSEATFLRSADLRSVRQRYCGFLDLSVEEFMQIQQHLLEEQMELVSGSVESEKLPNWRKSAKVDNFRRLLPLTTYPDYAKFLSSDQRVCFDGDPQWVHTSAPGGSFKRVPWTLRFQKVQARNVVAALILSSASGGHEIMTKPHLKVVSILPDKPFASAYLASDLKEQFHAQIIPAQNGDGAMPFRNKVDAALMQALSSDIDFVICMTSTLLRLSDRAVSMFGDGKVPLGVTQLHPMVSWRLLRSRFNARRPLVPGDLWSPKGIVGWGVDSDTLEDKIARQWGKPLFQMYASSESGIMSMQESPRAPMAFLPDSVFLEFLPHSELGTGGDSGTVLIDEVEDGKLYEPVVTSFYGMPLFRYRQGDLVRIHKSGKGNKAPRMVFHGRADDVIDVYGIARLNGETVARAVAAAGTGHNCWCLRKEYEKDRPVLKWYVELGDSAHAAELKHRFHRELMNADQHYREAVYTVALNPVRLAPLPLGAFKQVLAQNHLEQTQVRMNPPDAVVQGLLKVVGQVQ
ncbi:MAG: GH3 auxin-responsive promoter family protein [Dehalococcoidia bacterium]|nr:GH3 auxin-responsive promoter family protein [Dehalococcoidia bacterium]